MSEETVCQFPSVVRALVSVGVPYGFKAVRRRMGHPRGLSSGYVGVLESISAIRLPRYSLPSALLVLVQWYWKRKVDN